MILVCSGTLSSGHGHSHEEIEVPVAESIQVGQYITTFHKLSVYDSGNFQRIPHRPRFKYPRLFRGYCPGSHQDPDRDLHPAGRLRCSQMGHIRHCGPQLGPICCRSHYILNTSHISMKLKPVIAFFYMTIFCGISPVGIGAGIALKEEFVSCQLSVNILLSSYSG